MIIPIGSDHAGFETKQILIAHLTSLGYEVKDYGCYSDQSIDYQIMHILLLNTLNPILGVLVFYFADQAMVLA